MSSKPAGVFRVETPGFRRALDAVRRHADKTKTGGDGTQALRRIRIVLDPSLGYARVMATNLTTTAVAVVPLITADGETLLDLLDAADDDGRIPPAAVVDIQPRHAARILASFPVSRNAEGPQLVIRSYAGRAEITDVGGEMAGDAYTMSEPPDGDAFPDVWGIVAKASREATSTPTPKPLTTPGLALARFETAARLYETPLTILPSGSADSRGFVVACGPDFRGLISSGHNDDDSLQKRDAAERTWLARFAGPAGGVRAA